MSQASPPSSGIRNLFAAWSVMGVCLIATALTWLDVTNQYAPEQDAQFGQQATTAIINIKQAISSCELMLHHAAAFIANRAMHRAKWRNSIRVLSLQQVMPGVQKIGFADARDAKSIETTFEMLGQHRMPRSVHVASAYSKSAAVSLPLAPSHGKPSKAAFRISRSGSIGDVASVRHGDPPQTTVLMYLPVYSHSAWHTRHGRLGKFLGYVYARIGIHDLIESTLSRTENRPGVKLYEGSHANPGFLIYESEPSHASVRAQSVEANSGETAIIDINGSSLTIQLENSSSGLPHSGRSRAGIYIVGSGLLLAFSLFSVTRMISRVKRRAQCAEDAAPSGQERSQQELKNLVDAIQANREEEQKRLAQEMHDDLGQLLAAMKMDLADLARHIQPNDLKVLHRLDGINELVNSMSTSVRRIISDLPPKAIEDLGLFDALGLMAKNFEQRHRIRCHVCLPKFVPHVPQKAATAIYRMIQESLNNTAKHSGATGVEIRLEIFDNRLMLRIADNGKGFSAGDLQKAGSFGLIGMRERAASLNGSMRIECTGSEGATIYITLPIDAKLCRNAEAGGQPILTGSI